MWKFAKNLIGGIMKKFKIVILALVLILPLFRIDVFADTNTDEKDYDAIFTGDLGTVGSEITAEQLSKSGLYLGNKYTDCGREIFDIEKQDVHAGGSGCGCCASVFSGYIFKKMQKRELNKVLVCATGALMSTTSSFQGNNIPSIAHAVAIERIE